MVNAPGSESPSVRPVRGPWLEASSGLWVPGHLIADGNEPKPSESSARPAESEADVEWLVDECSLSLAARRKLGRLSLALLFVVGVWATQAGLGVARMDVVGRLSAPITSVALRGATADVGVLKAQMEALERFERRRAQAVQTLRYLQAVSPVGLRIQQLSLAIPPAGPTIGLRGWLPDLDANALQSFVDSLQVVMPTTRIARAAPAVVPAIPAASFAAPAASRTERSIP